MHGWSLRRHRRVRYLFPTLSSRTGSSSTPSISLHVQSFLLKWHECWRWPDLPYKFFSSSKIPASTDVSHTEAGGRKWAWIFSVLDSWLCEAEDLLIYLQSEERCSNTGSSATLQTLPWQHLAVLDKQCSDSWLLQSCPSAGDVQHHPLRVTTCNLGSHLQSKLSACLLCS